MSGESSRRRILQSLGGGLALAAGGCLGLGVDPEANVEDNRAELEAFGDVGTAIERDYRTTAQYVETEDGVLGESLLASPSTEPTETEPDVVTFNFAPDGTYEPLAVRWIVPEGEADGTPSLFGRSFDGPVEGRMDSVGSHYHLTVWLFRENPEGLFARYHPEVERPPFLDDLTRAREAVGAYLISTDAQEDGYANPETCADTDGGVYGVPFLKDPEGGTELSDPPVLRYRLTPNWTYELLGAEWFLPAEETEETPELFGQPFHEPMDGHLAETDQPRHRGLHAWLFRSNPEGLFAPFNSAIFCG